MMDAFDRLLLVQHLQIAALGWAVTAVVPTIPDNPGAPFAHTVGLTETGHAELLIAGLDPAVGMELLNTLAARVYYGGLTVAHGQRIGDLIAGYDAVIVEGPATEQLTPGTAFARYGRDRVTLAQIVWPCPHKLFPWQDGYCHPADAQPLLAQP
jgi:hypothetical protein